MTRRIEELVAENRQNTRRVESNFIEVGDSGRKDLSFSRNTVSVAVGIAVYRRPIGGGLISGHPDPSRGSGRGVSGDTRGDWTLVEDTADTAVFTGTGRTAIRDSLAGAEGSLAETGIGAGTADASIRDRDLSNPYSSSFAWGRRDERNVTTGTSIFLFADHGETATEFGLYDRTGRLLSRVTTPDISPTLDEEVRVVTSLTVEGEGRGNSVVTEDGEASIADSLRTPAETVGLNAMAFGTGTVEFSKTDIALSSEVVRKGVERDLDLESLRVQTLLYEHEPATQPVDLSEIGVYDNQNRLLWATTFRPETKADDVRLTASVGFRFR